MASPFWLSGCTRPWIFIRCFIILDVFLLRLSRCHPHWEHLTMSLPISSKKLHTHERFLIAINTRTVSIRQGGMNERTVRASHTIERSIERLRSRAARDRDDATHRAVAKGTAVLSAKAVHRLPLIIRAYFVAASQFSQPSLGAMYMHKSYSIRYDESS